MPAEVVRPALLVPQLAFFLCRTVEPAARAATALLGERPEEPTLVPLGVGPGMLETGGWQEAEAKHGKAMEISKDRRLEKLGQAPPGNLLAGSSLTPRTPGLSHHMPVEILLQATWSAAV